MPKSNYLATATLNHLLGKSTFTPPGTFYLALTTAAPSAGDTGSSISEASYTGYARVGLTAANFAALMANATSNSGTITFGTNTGAPQTMNGWCVCDASSGGNMLWFGSLPAVAVPTGAAPFVSAGQLTLAES